MSRLFLAKQGNARSHFYGALLNSVQESETVSLSSEKLDLYEVALLPIKVFSENNAPILGNIGERLHWADVAKRIEFVKTRTNVWGYLTPYKYANEITV